MKKTTRISVEECCMYYQIETSFVHQLNEYGLIELIRSGKKIFVPHEQLGNLEKYMHLHYDLDINMEGMEAITHILGRMQKLQQEIRQLKTELGKE